MEIVITAKVKGMPVEERYNGVEAERAKQNFKALYPSARAMVVKTVKKGSHLQVK